MAESEKDWSVLLIGGASCVGKTTLAESLARRLGARYIDLDLYWIVLQRAVPVEVAQDLHLFDDPNVFRHYEPEELVDQYLRVAHYVCDATEPLIAHHDIVGRRVVIEGCWVLPDHAVHHTYAGHRMPGSVRSAFLFEPEIETLEVRHDDRPPRNAHDQDPLARRNHLEMQWRYGLEIKRQAEALGLPVLKSRPFKTLEERALQALDIAP